MAAYLDGHQERARKELVPQGPSKSATKPARRLRNRLLGSGDWLEGQRYQLLERIAQGSTCSVFRARDAHRGGEVAIKIFSESFLRSPLAKDLIETEYRASTQVSHTHLVTVLGRGLHGGVPYLVMELLRGETLLDRLVNDGVMQPADALAITRDILSALASLHAHGVVHRDVKPQNVVLVPHVDAYGHVVLRAKLCDFGIAIVHGDAEQCIDGERSICGTPEYMSPEQAQALPIDGRSDLYSTGIMLFHMLTGELPFTADSPLHLTALQVEQELPSPRAFEPTICVEAEQILVKATQKAPGDRFSCALEMRAAIMALSHSDWAKTRRNPHPQNSTPKAVAYVKPSAARPVSAPSPAPMAQPAWAKAQPAWAKANTLRLRRVPDRLPQAVAAAAFIGLGALAVGSRLLPQVQAENANEAGAHGAEMLQSIGASVEQSVMTVTHRAAEFADTEHWLVPSLWGEHRVLAQDGQAQAMPTLTITHTENR